MIYAIGIYAFLILFFYFVQKEKAVFSTKSNWLKNGFSLFVVNFSITTPLLYSGILHNDGVSGLWVYWSVFLVSGIVPFIFASFWSKLNFISDNQFILFRYSGLGAKVLHVFRTIYVGWLMVALLLSFQILTFFKVLVFFTGFQSQDVFVYFSIFLILLTLKNRLSINISIDYLQSIFILAVLIITVIFFKYHTNSGFVIAKNNMLTPILPISKSYFFVIFFIQTWSVHLFDGSGTQAQRFFSTKTKSDVWKVAILAISLNVLFAIIFVYLNYRGNQLFGSPNLNDSEVFILSYLKQGVPNWFLPIVLISIFSLFISSFNGLLNWGASYLEIDGFQTYFRKKESKFTSLISMLIIVLTSIYIIYFNQNIETLTKVFFSISAGVAPVYIIRWFWLKINAWSQLSAMVCSGLFTIIYQNLITGSNIELELIQFTELNEYTLKLIFVTVLTTISWLSVTFLTNENSNQNFIEFRTTLLLNSHLKSDIIKALVFGIIVTGLLIFAINLLQS